MMKTVINIKNSKEIFKFPVIIKEENFHTQDSYKYAVSGDDVYIFRDFITKRIVNAISNEYIISNDAPQSKVWKATIVFPEHRDYNISEYFVDMYINIGRSKIHVLSTVINTGDLLALEKTMNIDGIRYYEGFDVDMPSVFDIVYDDAWSEVRRLCGEASGTNNAESLLVCEVTPVANNMVFPDYLGGYSTLSVCTTNDLRFSIGFDENYNIYQKLSFNDVYEGDFQLYMQETYGIENIYENYVIKYELVLKDNDNIYRFLEHEITGNDDIYITIHKQAVELGWKDWLFGLNFLGTFNIFNNAEECILTIYSNELPLTMETMAYLVSSTEKIDLDKIDMNIYNLDVVNKIEKRVVNVTNNDDKSNIINNVFIISNKIDDLIIYPQVTQNVLLPLNGYKNKVKTLYLQVEGVTFSEVGRNQQGVIFKVTGNLLPNETTSGVYYILNENKELVTTGNYTYK